MQSNYPSFLCSRPTLRAYLYKFWSVSAFCYDAGGDTWTGSGGTGSGTRGTGSGIEGIGPWRIEERESWR